MTEPTRRTFDRAVGVATLVLAASALSLTGLVTLREVDRRKPDAGRTSSRFLAQPDWEDYVREGVNRVGAEDARVEMVEFGDFQCPACAAFWNTLHEIRERYAGEFAVVYRHLPIARHEHSVPAAIASECAGRQGRFEAMHDALFAGQDSLGVRSWRAFAGVAGVADLSAFDGCMRDPEAAAAVDRDAAAARRLGARGTPTILINGIRFTGTLPPAVLDSLVRAAVRDSQRFGHAR